MPLEFDKNSYQTIFANPECTASIAPPGAGLHFSEEIIEELKKKGVRIAKVVLHIGQGIFDKSTKNIQWSKDSLFNT